MIEQASVGDFGRGQRDVLERISRGAPLREVLERVVNLIEEQADGMLCSILLLDAKGGCLRHGAAPGLPAALNQATDGAPIGPEEGSCGAAAYRGERVVVADIATHPFWQRYRQLALPYGLRACWSSPIFSPDRTVLGTFAIYHREAREPTAREIAWVDAATHLAAVAIDRAETERERDELLTALGARLVELTETQAVMRESQDRLRAVIDHTPDVAIQWFDRDGRVSFWNPASLTLYGWRPEEAMGKTLDELIFTAEQAATFRDFLREIERTGASIGPLEFTFRRRDGRAGVCRSTIFGIPGPGGTPCFVCMDVDITERKRAEEALRGSLVELSAANQRLTFHASRMPLASVVWDREFAITEWNASAERIFGWTAAEAIGRPISSLIVPPDVQPTVDRLWTDLVAGGTFGTHAIHENTRKDGARIICEWFNAPLRDDAGSVIGCLAMANDITAQRKAEEERRVLEAQLRQAQRIQSLGTLAGGIAHDFNNVLAAIAGNSHLALADLPAGHPVAECLREINKATGRATELVRQILMFSRHEVPRREVIGLRPIVQEAVNMLRATIPAMIEIKCHFDPDTPLISADVTQIHQILMNLSTNAAHAMDDHGVLEIRVEAVAADDEELARACPDRRPGRHARLTVSDTGIGMDRVTCEHIFEPFFTTKAVGEGTGLGLSVVHGIVKNHNAGIVVSSQLGAGTTFRLYFPAVEGTELRAGAAGARATVPRGTGQRILYVDDDASLVLLTTRVLRRLGYAVTDCAGGSQAFELFRANPQQFDMVVTDLAMPGMSGIDLAREIRLIRPDTPVVLTSGYIRAEDTLAAQKVGLTEVILKPGTVEELGVLLDRIFSAGRPGSAGAPPV